jgi:enamine deaminase RidA (YjgF/YER057c/UK114 family)
MPVELEIRTLESPVATEIYISAVAEQNAPPQQQAGQILSAIAETLRSKNAAVLQERIFATQAVIDVVSKLRSKAYADIDDGVTPSLLLCTEEPSGPVAGAQVHAIIAETEPEPIDFEQAACGRILRLPGRTYLTLSNLSAPELTEPTEQARAMLEKAESVLKEFGADFLSVPRTWIWLADILSWYGDFNRVRNEFFRERGIIGQPTRQSMPASTGIGLAPAGGQNCAMDLIAVLEPAESIQYLPAVGKQHCALEYGSAFSRASHATTPAGRTVFVSGTASIDATGATTNIGDPEGQINATIENVQAVLKDMKCADSDVVQVVAYCKTPDVQNVFDRLKGALPWPWVTVICDICRPDLLFEVEAVATPRK